MFVLVVVNAVVNGQGFPTPIGTPLDYSNVRREFITIVKAAGLPAMRIHDLRHTCASLLIAKGVHLKVIQDVLGHSQISVTADTYAHVGQPLREEAARSIDEALGGSSRPSASAAVVVNAVVKPGQEPPVTVEILQNYWEEEVSPLGIEPRTNRLRVCCSTN